MKRSFILRTCGSALAIALSAGGAQAEDDASAEAAEIETASEIVVQAGIGVRTRSDVDAEPVLIYDESYFQRFEPLTAGDALKRVPSVTFLSDVIESDGVRMRGLAPGYTQITINGERVPGGSDDRSFFMDRIPAELISRVEIVRSSSARRTGDAMAGTINIELRDGYELDGGYVRAGGLLYRDDELEPSFGLVYGGEVGPGRILLGANLQGRHNPKLKESLRYEPDGGVLEFDNREDQTDTRDGKDYSFNGTYKIDGETTDIELNGFYVRTDRTETERSFEYDDETAINGPMPTGNLASDNANVAEIDQENFSLGAKVSQEWALGKTSVKVGYAQFKEDRVETEYEIGFDVDYDDGEVPEFEGAITVTDLLDKEFSVKLDHETDLGSGIDLVFGGLYQEKDRSYGLGEDDQDDEFAGLETSWDQFNDNPTDLAEAFGNVSLDYTALEEIRKDAFALVEKTEGPVTWEVGLRYETTKSTVDGIENDYNRLLPSASLKWDITDRDRILISGARTVRRPDFNFLNPVLLEEEVGDSDLLGNPLLRPETAWGIDVGYEHRLGARGVVGVNFFYRDVTDLIELANTGDEGSEGPGTWIFQPQNVGNGKVYGIEFDLSTDLDFIGLPDTGLFGNFSWLDSEVTDFLGQRRFNDQSKYVYNFGFIQNMPKLAAAFGATYRKQGPAYGRVIAEEVTTTYGAELEVFVEKRFGDSFTIRAVGSNLLNGHKNEAFNKYDSINDQISHQIDDLDEYELESERAGPVFQLMARYAF